MLSAGAYLSPGFHYPVYGKMSGREEVEKVNTSPSISVKSTTESKALDLLQQHANQYRSKSPVVRYSLFLKNCIKWHNWKSERVNFNWYIYLNTIGIIIHSEDYVYHNTFQTPLNHHLFPSFHHPLPEILLLSIIYRSYCTISNE